MRVIEINNKEIYDGLKEKDVFVQDGRKVSEEIEKLEEERNKLGLQIQKIKDRIIPAIEEEVKNIELTEYEAVGEVRAGEADGVVEVQVFDQVEAYREFLDDKKKEEQAAKEAQTDGNGEV